VPTEDILQRLRDADALWRAELKRVEDVLSVADQERDQSGEAAGEWRALAVERRALQVAIKTLDLCIARQVVPRLEGVHFVTEIVIPTRHYPTGTAALELMRMSHGPVAIECEHYCQSAPAALDLVTTALHASASARGWAPIYVRLWRELVRDGA
jgi:hypothetical protein